MENNSNYNCENESLSLVETKQDVSETFNNYLQNSLPSVKLTPVSDSIVSVFINIKVINKYLICVIIKHKLLWQTLLFYFYMKINIHLSIIIIINLKHKLSDLSLLYVLCIDTLNK